MITSFYWREKRNYNSLSGFKEEVQFPGVFFVATVPIAPGISAEVPEISFDYPGPVVF